jgi:plastocyanin
MPRCRPLAAVVALAAPLLAGCAGDDRSGAGPATVTIVDFAFGPAAIEVPAGTTIAFENRDGQAHTATARGGAFNTEGIPAGERAEVTVERAGSIPFFCALHPFMEGTVEVQ